MAKHAAHNSSSVAGTRNMADDGMAAGGSQSTLASTQHIIHTQGAAQAAALPSARTTTHARTLGKADRPKKEGRIIMTKQDYSARIAETQARRDMIRDTRKTAQLARLLWPQEDDDLHVKVEIVQQQLRAARQDVAAWRIADSSAHRAAWRKVKRVQHIKDAGDVTQAQWYKRAQAAQDAVGAAWGVAWQVARMTACSGNTDTTRRLVDAAYWAAHDAQTAALDARNAIPLHIWASTDAAIDLYTAINDWCGRIQAVKDDLVSWADDHGHAILR